MKMIHQFMLAIFLPTFLICLFITGFTGIYLTTHIQKTTTQSLEEQMHRYAIEVERQLEFMSHGAEIQKQYIEQTLDFEAFKNDLSYRESYSEQLHQIVLTLAQQESFQGGYSVTFVPQFTDSVIQIGTQDFDDNGIQEPTLQLSISYFTTETSDPDKDWFFKPLKTGDAVWTGPYTKKNGLPNHQYMTISYPILYNNQMIGVTSTDYDFQAFSRLVEQFQYHETGYVSISDINHRFILHPAFSGEYLNEIENEKYKFITQKVEAFDSGIIEYKWINNESKVLAFKHLSNFWILYLATNKADVYLSVGSLMWITYGLFAFAIVFSFFIAWLLGKWVTGPITEMTATFNAEHSLKEMSASGNSKLHRNDEISNLANSIYSLRNSQSKLANALEDYNQNLSLKVDDRNKDLIHLNHHLNETRTVLENQQVELRHKNRALEDSIEEIMSIQKQLIHSDKIASFGYMVTGIAEEIDIPVGHSTELVRQMTEKINLVVKALIEKTADELMLQEHCLQIEGSNQDLLRNLYFTKDIIDYIKDIIKSKSQQKKLPIVIKDAIINSAHSAIGMANKKNVRLTVHCQEQLTILSEVELFSHILFSIFTTLLYDATVINYDYFMTAKVIKSDGQLKITIFDNAATLTLEQIKKSPTQRIDESIDETNEIISGGQQTRHLKMGFNMIYILMTEFFKGDFKITQQQHGIGNIYTLIFYDVTFI